MEIIRTRPGESEFYLFDDLPKQLYDQDSQRFNQRESISEYLEACYVLVQNGKPIARAALYQNPFLFYNGMKASCIGNYECIRDERTAEVLLEFVKEEAKRSSADFLIGPMNGSTWDNYRWSQHHKYTNFLLEPYHHLYYNSQFLSNGFRSIANYVSSIDTCLLDNFPELNKRESDLSNEGTTIRNIAVDKFEDELKALYPFLSSAFEHNFLYTPIRWESFRDKYKEALRMINPEFLLLAEDAQKNVVGFIFAYDDIFNTTEKSLVLKTLARDKTDRWFQLGQVLVNKIISKAKSKGYTSVVHAFMINNAASGAISKSRFEGTVYKNYVLYGAEL